METVNFDLGNNMQELVASSPMSKEDTKSYPSFYIDDPKGELELPSSGRMIVEFKRRNKTESEDDKGNERCSYSIDVRKIVAVEPDDCCEAPAKNLGKNTEDVLDALLKKVKGKNSDDEEND